MSATLCKSNEINRCNQFYQSGKLRDDTCDLCRHGVCYEVDSHCPFGRGPNQRTLCIAVRPQCAADSSWRAMGLSAQERGWPPMRYGCSPRGKPLWDVCKKNCWNYGTSPGCAPSIVRQERRTSRGDPTAGFTTARGDPAGRERRRVKNEPP